MLSGGLQDYVYNPDGTKDVNVKISTGQSFAEEQKFGTRKYGSQYGATGQFFADVDLDSEGASDLVYDRADSREIRILRYDGAKLGGDEKWGTRSDDVASNGKRQWIVNVSTDPKLDVVYNSSSDSKAIRVLVNGESSTLGSDTKWAPARTTWRRTRLARRHQRRRSRRLCLCAQRLDGAARPDQQRRLFQRRRALEESHLRRRLRRQRPMARRPGRRRRSRLPLQRQRHARAAGMLDANGMLGDDVFWGDRMWGIGYDGLSQWVTDFNGDCRADFVYGRDQTREYWALLSNGTQFSIDQWRGNRAWGVGFDGKSDWLGRLQHNSMHEQINNRDGTKDYWVMVPQSTQPAGTCPR